MYSTLTLFLILELYVDFDERSTPAPKVIGYRYLLNIAKTIFQFDDHLIFRLRKG